MKITMKKYCKKDYGEWVQYAGMCAARRQPAVKRSDVSINQLPSKANPHPVSVMAYSHSLRQCPLIQIHPKTYLFSLLWASTHTKLTIPTPENWGFSRVGKFEVWTGKKELFKTYACQPTFTCSFSFCMLIQLIWSHSVGVFIDISGIIVSMGQQVACTLDQITIKWLYNHTTGQSKHLYCVISYCETDPRGGDRTETSPAGAEQRIWPYLSKWSIGLATLARC